MKRPLCVMGASFAVATAVAFFCSPREGLSLSVAFLLTGLMVWLLQKKHLTVGSLALFSAGLALAYGSFWQMKFLVPFAPVQGEEIMIQALVTEAKQTASGRWRYLLEGTFPGTSLPSAKVILREYGDSSLTLGDMIQLPIALREPTYQGTVAYYRRHGIVGEAVLEHTVHWIAPTGKYKIHHWILQRREHYQQRLYAALPTSSAQLTSAMVLGITEDLPPALYSALNRSGTSHLVSVSGLHLSIVVGFVRGILQRLKLSQRKQVPLLLLASLGFALLVGFSAPIVRALIMVWIMLLGQLGARKSDSLSSLGFSALLISILWPYWTLQLGMWLSFLSTAGILVVGSRWANALYLRYGAKRGKGQLSRMVTDGLGITLGAYVFTLPVLFIATGWVSLISPLANVLVSPFAGVLTGGGILLFLLPSGFFLVPGIAAAVHFCSRMIVEVSTVLAKFPFAIFSLDQNYLLVGTLFATLLIVVGLVLGQVLGQVQEPQEERKENGSTTAAKTVEKTRRKRPSVVALFATLGAIVLGGSSLLGGLYTKNITELVVLEDCQTTLLVRGTSGVLLGTPSHYDSSSILSYLEFRGIRSLDAVIVPDHGEKLSPALTEIGEKYPIKAIIGPDDSFILDQLAQGFAGTPVHSIGFAEITVLEGTRISWREKEKLLGLQTGDQKISKSFTNYAIIEQADDSSDEIIIAGSELWLPSDLSPRWEPIGAFNFKETRIQL